MVNAAILHPPAFGGTVKSVDKAAALAVPGVVAVEAIPQGVVVYAKDTFAALKGRSALKVEWDLSKAEKRSTEDLVKTYSAAAATPGKQVEVKGDVAAALAGAAKTIEATYRLPVPRARPDGADGRGDRARQGKGRCLDGQPVPGRRHDRHGQGTRHPVRGQ